ncbi:MAG: hypothetical protein N2444_04805, partial [Methylocystis sp.]|nr:hypothetical protein [Methylocystis sp.]
VQGPFPPTGIRTLVVNGLTANIAPASGPAVALLRAALIVMEEGDREQMERALGPLMSSDNAFRYSAQEWNGLDALANDDFDEAERVFEQVLNDRDAPQSMRQRAAAYKGLLLAKRGPKKVEAKAGGAGDLQKIEVTPVVEPEDPNAAPPKDAPFEIKQGK